MVTFKFVLINDVTHLLYIILIHSTIFITFQNKNIHRLVMFIILMNLSLSIMNGFKCPYEEATYIYYPTNETITYVVLLFSLLVNIYKSKFNIRYT